MLLFLLFLRFSLLGLRAARISSNHHIIIPSKNHHFREKGLFTLSISSRLFDTLAASLREPVQLDGQCAALQVRRVLPLDGGVRGLGRREAHGAVAARAAVAANHDVGALDLAVLVEERAELLFFIGLFREGWFWKKGAGWGEGGKTERRFSRFGFCLVLFDFSLAPPGRFIFFF